MIAIWIILALLGFLILIMILLGVRIVPQTRIYIVERLGSFKKILKNGVNFIVPFIDKIILRESLKERVLDFPAQDVITKDNVTMKIDTVVYMQITDPKLFAYGVDRPLFAVENLTATTLRNLIGDLELDQTLTSRDAINERLRAILDEATDPWGMKILRVELKNILPPQEIRRAMEKQMRAEREKREQILIAEGKKNADILEAEGKKRASILEAEGIKQSIGLINSSHPSKESLILKSYDALVEVSKGDSTTLILPSDLTDIASIASTFGITKSKLESIGSKASKTSKTKGSSRKTKTLDEIIESVKK